jgi:hypothetical protein
MPIACLSELMKRPRARAGRDQLNCCKRGSHFGSFNPRARAGVASLVPIMDKQKSGGGFYQTRRMSFTDLKFAVENDERESQCLVNRDVGN